MIPLPSVVIAEYRGAHRIHVVFGDGVESTIDFLPWLNGPIFQPLLDTDYFRRFFIEPALFPGQMALTLLPRRSMSAPSLTRRHNKGMNLTVWASRPLLVLDQSLLRTVARKGRATQPAGYAQRYRDTEELFGKLLLKSLSCSGR